MQSFKRILSSISDNPIPGVMAGRVGYSSQKVVLIEVGGFYMSILQVGVTLEIVVNDCEWFKVTEEQELQEIFKKAAENIRINTGNNSNIDVKRLLDPWSVI